MGNQYTHEEEFMEFDTVVLDIDGEEKELAITEEFEFEGKTYILCNEVVGDEIIEEGTYLFEGISEGEEIVINSIDSEEEYDRIVEAYYASFEGEEE